MKRIVKEILDAEERVDGTLRQAREQAAEIVRSAEQEIAAKLNDAREKAREIVQTGIEDAERQAKQIRQEKLSHAEEQQELLLHGNAEIVDDLVSQICEIILASEREEDPA